ncbi:hypothetical protein BZK31_00220 [Pseudomonas floridensis]|uniref:Uncharacterized protein n=1 Tax=Pseudomonas floridensis TaxID=1958950 RepID=A0A1X0NDH7_9PSED|nr:hypothetical protein BZK31_00220 [Pseudomonas floridensis]
MNRLRLMRRTTINVVTTGPNRIRLKAQLAESAGIELLSSKNAFKRRARDVADMPHKGQTLL